MGCYPDLYNYLLAHSMKFVRELGAFLQAAFMVAVVTSALFFGYVMSAGPAYYVSHRHAISHPLLFSIVQTCYRPTDCLALRHQRYWDYLHGCASKGVDGCLEEWSANQSLHSTPR